MRLFTPDASREGRGGARRGSGPGRGRRRRCELDQAHGRWHRDARSAAGHDPRLHLPPRRRRPLLGRQHRAVPAPDVAAALPVRQERPAGPERARRASRRRPVFTKGNTRVTITLKPYKWSDGKPVTRRDFTFLLEPAQGEQEELGGLPARLTCPTTSKQVKVVNEHTFTLVLDRSYSPIWFTGNQLSQLMPIPQHAWDKKSAGGAGRQLRPDDRRRDGRLQLPDRRGEEAVELRHEPALAGRRRPVEAVRTTARTATRRSSRTRTTPARSSRRSTKFVEQPFTTAQAELNVLRSGGDRLRLPAAVGGRTGEGAREAGVHLRPWVSWGINYCPVQLREPDDRGRSSSSCTSARRCRC